MLEDVAALRGASKSGNNWRRKRDSNPRAPFEANGFQDRRFQPLTHPSGLYFQQYTMHFKASNGPCGKPGRLLCIATGCFMPRCPSLCSFSRLIPGRGEHFIL